MTDKVRPLLTPRCLFFGSLQQRDAPPSGLRGGGVARGQAPADHAHRLRGPRHRPEDGPGTHHQEHRHVSLSICPPRPELQRRAQCVLCFTRYPSSELKSTRLHQITFYLHDVVTFYVTCKEAHAKVFGTNCRTGRIRYSAPN